ncbi:MAG: hypothetical protein WAR21_14580 [Candidatus Acidiferrales bacterium]
MTHFDEMTCLLYLEGQLERPRALELSSHTQGCAECRALLRALEGESRLLARALVEEDEAVPARLLAPPAREATPWAWIVSFGLAAAGAYTLWTGIVEPWRQQLSQAGFGESNLLTLLFFRGAFWKGWGSMANAVQFLALTTLGILVFGLLRRTWRRWTTIAMVMGAVAVALALPPSAAAAEYRKAQTFVLAKDEVVKNDLIVTGGTIRIDGTVEGDLIFFGETVEVNGHVTGDVIGFGKVFELDGKVDGNVRAFVNSLWLRGFVAKNVSIFAENVGFKEKSSVGGGAMLFAAHAALEGRLGRDLMGFIGKTMLNGYIGGNATLHSDHLSIGSSAEIAGKTRYMGGHQPEVSPQAKLSSPLETTIKKPGRSYSRPRYFLKQALSWGAAFLFGLILVLLMPRFFADVVRSSREYVVAPLLGIATLVGVPFLAIIACITIVGLAVGIGSVLIWIVTLYAAQTFVGAWLGERLMGPPAGTSAVVGRLAVGLVVFKIAGMLPYVGVCVRFLVLIWGLGALTLTLYRRAQSLPAPAGAGQAVV